MNKHIMISAGEASGDILGAAFLGEMQMQSQEYSYSGMGFTQLREQGMKLVVNCQSIAVMGVVEVLGRLPQIRQAMALMKAEILAKKPAVLVLIDFVEFNLKLAAFAKKNGIKVLFYVSPQVWAWRQGRVPKIGRVIDMMAVLFPFEEAIYKKHGVPVRFVGHPMVDRVQVTLPRNEFLSSHNLQAQGKTLCLLPGSRSSELKQLVPLLVESAFLIHKTHPQTQFLMPLAPTVSRQKLSQMLSDLGAEKLNIILVENNTYNAVAASDAVLCASGTATLEVGLLEVPMAVVYRINPLSYMILRRLVKIEHIGLANIVAGQECAKELIQQNAQPEAIADEARRLLFDTLYNRQRKAQLATIAPRLGDGGGSKRLALLALEMINSPSGLL